MFGTLTSTSLTVDNHGKFTVDSTGQVIVNSLKLSAWSETSVALTAVFGSSSSKVAVDTFEIGYEANITFAHSELNIETSSFKMDSLSKIIVAGSKKKITITSTDFTLQDGAEISVSGGGELDSGSGSASGTEGASYGGEGGENLGTTYGSSIMPVDYGSGSTSARGGGIINLIISATAEIDGSLLANGANSTSTGGASGGTIYIEAATLQGHGKLSVNGGDSSVGGGGGGGRIALKAPLQSDFLGDVTSYGATGVTETGAAGTIYKEYEQSGGSQIKKVIIDNNGMVTDAFSHINGAVALTELEINGYGQVQFDGTASTFEIGTVTGDYTGTLTVLENQVYEIATSYGTLTPYALMCKLTIKENGEATIPAKILLTDDDTTGLDWYNLEVYGTVLGMREMTVSSGGRVLLHSQSRSGLSSTNLKPIGTLSLSKVDVTTDGLLELSVDSMDPYTLEMIKEFNVKYGGTVTGRNLFIESPAAEIAYGGILNVNGGNLDPGESSGDSGTTGAGGSHGGSGGASSDNVQPSANYTGVINKAIEFGSAGGNGTTSPGEKGGGFLQLTIANSLTLHGLVSANGNGNGSIDGGGGSGGAVFILVSGDMDGSGTVSVQGGNSGSGGGGGGGRIHIQVDGSFDYLGDYRLCGGSSATGQAGGSGTAFATFQQTGTPGYVNYAYLDNSCASGAFDGVTFIDLPGITLYEVSNLNIGDTTKVWLQTASLHFKAKTLTCGTGSTILVDNDVVFSADVDLSYSAITCSFDLKQDGEIRLPNSVELKGEASTLEGLFPLN